MSGVELNIKSVLLFLHIELLNQTIKRECYGSSGLSQKAVNVLHLIKLIELLFSVDEDTDIEDKDAFKKTLLCLIVTSIADVRLADDSDSDEEPVEEVDRDAEEEGDAEDERKATLERELMKIGKKVAQSAKQLTNLMKEKEATMKQLESRSSDNKQRIALLKEAIKEEKARAKRLVIASQDIDRQLQTCDAGRALKEHINGSNVQTENRHDTTATRTAAP